MIPLSARGRAHLIDMPLIGPVTRCIDHPNSIFLWTDDLLPVPEVAAGAVLSTGVRPSDTSLPTIYSLNRANHLQEGDIVALHADGLVQTLYRIASPHNSLFITDRCNSNCLMCSQPPKNRDDLDILHDLNTRLIPWIPKETQELGITGGEPTLLGKRLPELLRLLKDALPQTAVHMLTNGRAFAWPQVTKALAAVDHPDLVLGIPLYADYYALHDYIVQASNAFHQTVLGLHQLARAGQRIEIRVVVHRQSVTRLPKLARFITKNLPFVEHVAFMGLEHTGYTPHNDHLLFLEPAGYIAQLDQAVTLLDDLNMAVSLYNMPLCLVPEKLWQFCRKSISDWKRGFLPACQTCSVIEQCGGLFETSRKHSAFIRPISQQAGTWDAPVQR